MAVYKSKGIVLRSIRYGEADRIVDLYTSDSGLVSTIAKGIRRTRSRFGARLEPLSCVDFMAYEGRTLDTVTQVEVLRSFHDVREDLGRFAAASGLVGTVRALSGGDEPDRRIFNLLYRGLENLEYRDSGYDSLQTAFSLKLSMLAGYALQLDSCMSCSQGINEFSGGHLYYAPALGGLLCTDCRPAVGEAFPIPPGAIDSLERLISKPLRDAEIPNGLNESVKRVVRSHVFAHAPGSSSLGASGSRRPA
ncbi:MAG: DNA repair protein RecO [Rubrobacteraceae bacterium]